MLVYRDAKDKGETVRRTYSIWHAEHLESAWFSSIPSRGGLWPGTAAHDRPLSAKSSHCVDTEWDAVGVLSNAGSNLFFSSTLSKHKPLILINKIGGLCLFGV